MSWRAASISAPLVAALLAAAIADGQPRGRSRLVYVRGPGANRCPEEQAIRESVAARLGYNPFSVDNPDGEVSASISRRDTGLIALVEVRDRSGMVTGSREIESVKNDCDELASAVTLAISIAVDPLSVTGSVASASAPPPPLPQPLPPSPPPVVTVFVARPHPPPLPPKKDPIRLRATLGMLTSFGSAPAAALGATVSTGVRWRALSASVEGRADFGASASRSDGARVRSSQLLASLVPCVHGGVIVGCGLLSVGAMRGTGQGVSSPRKQTTPYGAAGARLGLELPASESTFLRVYGDILAPLARTTLRIDGTDLWTTPPVSVVMGAGVGGEF